MATDDLKKLCRAEAPPYLFGRITASIEARKRRQRVRSVILGAVLASFLAFLLVFSREKPSKGALATFLVQETLYVPGEDAIQIHTVLEPLLEEDYFWSSTILPEEQTETPGGSS